MNFSPGAGVRLQDSCRHSRRLAHSSPCVLHPAGWGERLHHAAAAGDGGRALRRRRGDRRLPRLRQDRVQGPAGQQALRRAALAVPAPVGRPDDQHGPDVALDHDRAGRRPGQRLVLPRDHAVGRLDQAAGLSGLQGRWLGHRCQRGWHDRHAVDGHLGRPRRRATSSTARPTRPSTTFPAPTDAQMPRTNGPTCSSTPRAA